MKRRGGALLVVLGAGVSMACSADDIVVYRVQRGPAMDADGSGGRVVLEAGGGAPAAGNGAANNGGTPGHPPGSGGHEETFPDAMPSKTPGSGGDMGSGGSAGSAGTGGLLGSGGLPLPPLTCTTVTDCPSGSVCAKLACGMPAGVCQRALPCELSSLPVCGCDGVTYWNDCLRQQSGVAPAALSQCLQAKTCTTGADCGVAGASCARLNLGSGPGGMCNPSTQGTCWVVPTDCAATIATPTWTSCNDQAPPGMPPRGICVNTCAAIRSEQPFVTATPNAQCR